MGGVVDRGNVVGDEAHVRQSPGGAGADSGQLDSRKVAAILFHLLKDPAEGGHTGRAGKYQPPVVFQMFQGGGHGGAGPDGTGFDTGVFPHVRPQGPQPVGEGPGPVAGPGHQDPLAPERQVVEPAEPLRQGADLSHQDDGGAVDTHGGGPLRQGGQGGVAPPLGAGGAVFHHGGGGVRVHAGFQQALHNGGHGSNAHQEHQGALCPHQGLKVDGQGFACPLVAGDDVDGGAVVPVGHRNPPIGGGGDGGGDAGDLLEGDAPLRQGLQLLSAPAEHEGVASFQTHHVVPRQGLLQQDAVDLLLGHLVVGGLLAHVDGTGLRGDHGQNGGAYQAVVHHHVRPGQGRPALQGQQARIPGTCPHQRYFSAHDASSFSCRASSAARAGPCSRGPEILPRYSRFASST